jgi:UDP-N-acetylmuramyl pentapeptide phosphotransferase/UDP-N-acetylglucosamine-1-phosphate transferase
MLGVDFPHWLIALLVGVVAAAASGVALQAVRNIALRFNLVDRSESHKPATRPIPRIGGLAICLGFLAGLGASFMLPVDRFQIEVERVVLLIIGSVIVVGTMFYDDVVGMRPLPKLACQLTAACVVVLPRLRGSEFGIVIEQFNTPIGDGVQHLPLFVALVFTVVWIVGMMNSLNWSDGIDGLAGTITLIAALVLFGHTYFRPSGDPQFTISLLAAALVGAVVGFLPANWHPARIIMGDSGAMFLGFSLATISIIGGAKIATALLALGIPILDMAWVIIFRLIHGRSPLLADRGHLHHRLLDAGLSHPQVVLCFGSLSAIFGVLALALPTRENKLIAMIAMGLVLLAVIAVLAARQSSGLRTTR